MRLVTYQRDGHARSGVVLDCAVLDTGWASNRALLEAGERALRELDDAARRGDLTPAGPLDEQRLGPPIADPDKIVCLGLNYRDHAKESGLALPAAPMLFAKFRNSLTGPADPIVLPARGERFDYEAELAVVIGRRAKDVGAADALAYVAGAMALNDVTARDIQHATSQWTAGKAIDTFAPCGPALVSLDELGDVQDLAIGARVNGVTVQAWPHRPDDLQRRRDDRVRLEPDDARARRHHRDGHAGRRRRLARPAGAAARRRRRRGRDRGHRRPLQPGRGARRGAQLTMLRVGHVGLQVADLERSIAFAERILGLRVSERDGGTAYLTCNERHHELVLIAGERSALDHLAFEVFDRWRYDALAERLAVLERGRLEPGLDDALRFLAPGGFTVELFHGMAHDQPRHYDSIAPRPLKFEHVTVKSTRKDELEQLLVDVLGLRLSDRADDAASWLRAGDEHHGVSVIAADVDALHTTRGSSTASPPSRASATT
jgi:2-keto-4-pentenoate hydratase/2-oxohepta-3-ene-1,7-dioic acid hydratase in catechol pathway/catechol 2,3-dioxygenase-like lactoylglutathione lyase family enzyme